LSGSPPLAAGPGPRRRPVPPASPSPRAAPRPSRGRRRAAPRRRPPARRSRRRDREAPVDPGGELRALVVGQQEAVVRGVGVLGGAHGVGRDARRVDGEDQVALGAQLLHHVDLDLHARQRGWYATSGHVWRVTARPGRELAPLRAIARRVALAGARPARPCPRALPVAPRDERAAEGPGGVLRCRRLSVITQHTPRGLRSARHGGRAICHERRARRSPRCPGRAAALAPQGRRIVPVTSTTTSPPTRTRSPSRSAIRRLGRPISVP
jgi:hypothetical protein